MPSKVAVRSSLVTWRNQLARAVYTACQRLRESKGLKPLPDGLEVLLPHGSAPLLRLLNLRVWSLRYCVPLEFVIEALLDRYDRARRPADGAIQLGLPPTTLTGVKARAVVEAAVLRAYPAGENFRAAVQPSQREPLVRLSYREEADMPSAYALAVARRRTEPVAVPRRPYRRPKPIRDPNAS